ncbi:MAG TPA: aldo/keto reductase [Burkholderiales bacterium]|nr:aldo/keto reductase [Burkholderiales bacterium]
MNQATAFPSRRAVLKGIAGTGAWLAIGAPQAQQPSTGGEIVKRTIPGSGERIPVIGLGTYQAFDVGTSSAERTSLKAVLTTLVARGGSVVDSSPMYGRAEGVIGDLAAELELRASLFLATKVWTSGREAGIRQMENSFRLMRTQTMDLMQIHNLLDWRTHTATLQAWKSQGRVRYIGITHYHAGAYDELQKLMRTRAYDFVQLNYSIAEREAERSVLPLAQELGMAVIANRPFAQANLFARVRGKTLPDWARDFDCNSWAQFFLKYIVSHPALTCAIPATSKPEHMVDDMQAGYGRLPDERQRRDMVEIMESI